jgi:uncharacterized protein (DUF1501 family)
MTLSRRSFLQGTGLTVASLASGVQAFGDPTPAVKGSGQRALVIIQLSGGNDGLNTVAPVNDPAYRKLRPTVGLKPNEALDLDGKLSLHTSMAKLHALFGQGGLAIVQGVGYPQPNRSHFESTAIWQMARLQPHLEAEGWLGRAITARGAGAASPFGLVGIGGGTLAPVLLAEKQPATALASLDAFAAQPDRRFPGDAPALLKALAALYPGEAPPGPGQLISRVGKSALAGSERLRAAVNTYQSMVNYPRGPFGDQLRLAAQLLGVDLGVRVVHVTLGGFDTHANQKRQQQTLLGTLADGIAALLEDAKAHGFSERIAVMTYSEFGRRAAENGSGGTDHGSGSVLFLAGEKVKGGLHGPTPDLEKLDGGDVAFGVDFRAVYAAVLHDWLQLPTEPALPRGATPLSLFRTS